MALPVSAAASLAADMAKKGISGSISMGEPKKHMGSGDLMGEAPEKDDPMSDVPEDVKPVIADIDAMMPGLGKLMLELCEKLMNKDMGDDESLS